MVVRVIKDFDNRETYKKGVNKNVIFNVYCFLCGFIAAMIIAIMIL